MPEEIQTSVRLANDRDEWRERAERLWRLLDDIDTQDDACRDQDDTFRTRARKSLRRRHEILTSSDGYTLRVPT